MFPFGLFNYFNRLNHFILTSELNTPNGRSLNLDEQDNTHEFEG